MKTLKQFKVSNKFCKFIGVLMFRLMGIIHLVRSQNFPKNLSGVKKNFANVKK